MTPELAPRTKQKTIFMQTMNIEGKNGNDDESKEINNLYFLKTEACRAGFKASAEKCYSSPKNFVRTRFEESLTSCCNYNYFSCVSLSFYH